MVGAPAASLDCLDDLAERLLLSRESSERTGRKGDLFERLLVDAVLVTLSSSLVRLVASGVVVVAAEFPPVASLMEDTFRLGADFRRCCMYIHIHNPSSQLINGRVSGEDNVESEPLVGIGNPQRTVDDEVGFTCEGFSMLLDRVIMLDSLAAVSSLFPVLMMLLLVRGLLLVGEAAALPAIIRCRTALGLLGLRTGVELLCGLTMTGGDSATTRCSAFC